MCIHVNVPNEPSFKYNRVHIINTGIKNTEDSTNTFKLISIVVLMTLLSVDMGGVI